MPFFVCAIPSHLLKSIPLFSHVVCNAFEWFLRWEYLIDTFSFVTLGGLYCMLILSSYKLCWNHVSVESHLFVLFYLFQTIWDLLSWSLLEFFMVVNDLNILNIAPMKCHQTIFKVSPHASACTLSSMYYYIRNSCPLCIGLCVCHMFNIEEPHLMLSRWTMRSALWIKYKQLGIPLNSLNKIM